MSDERRDEAEAMSERIDALVAVPQPDRLVCPECEALGESRAFANRNGLGVHRSTIHGVRGPNPKPKKKTGRPRGRPPGSRNVPKPAKPAVSTPDWDVDDIFGPVLAQMFPSGVIPVHAVLALVRWRSDTLRMLIEVADDRNG